MRDQRRNLNPHKPAVAAMYIYHDEYAAYRGGSMDFWDALPGSSKRVCRDLLNRLAEAPEEPADAE